jgi:hypothetical protein
MSRVTRHVALTVPGRASAGRLALRRPLMPTHDQQSPSLDNSGGAKQTTRMEMHLRLLRPTIFLQTLAASPRSHLLEDEPTSAHRTC